MIHERKRTNIFIVNKEVWAWAHYWTKRLDYHTTSEYLFDLIKLNKEKDIVKKKI